MQEIIISKWESLKTYLKTDQGKSLIALLPLFFSWQPVILYNFDNPVVKRNCLYSMLFTAYFFASLFISFILSFIPFIGQNIAGLIHLLGVLLYLSLSGFFIYSLLKEKNVVIAIVEKHLEHIQKFV
jgi:hypothetical protein